MVRPDSAQQQAPSRVKRLVLPLDVIKKYKRFCWILAGSVKFTVLDTRNNPALLTQVCPVITEIRHLY